MSQGLSGGLPKAACLLLWLSAVEPALCVELRIHYSALQRVLAEQIFTQEGRRYVRGQPDAKCSYAYLERPEVGPAGNGRLFVKAHFSGRSAGNFFGKCVGLGGDFDVHIAAAPYYQDGRIALRDVRVDSPGRDGLYIRRVRLALAESITRQFEYRVMDDARKLIEQSPYRPELVSFSVPAMQVTGEALVLTVDFTLAVR
ncbi:MAG: hypothetical protein ACRD8O_04505 [Bryobacteraceae bacterium]